MTPYLGVLCEGINALPELVSDWLVRRVGNKSDMLRFFLPRDLCLFMLS